MDQSKRGRGRPRKQEEEHSTHTSGGRKTRLSKYTEDQNQKKKGFSENSTSVVDKNKDFVSSVENRTSSQKLVQKDLIEGSAATEDRKKGKDSVEETRHFTRRSGRVSTDKHQEKYDKHDHTQQKVLTEYFQSFPSQCKASTSALKQKLSKNGSDSSCHDNQGDKGLTSNVQTPRTRSGRKVSASINKDEKTVKKSYNSEIKVPGKENQGIETTRRRRGRSAKVLKNPGISEGLTEKTSFKELLKESPGLHTSSAGLSSSPRSSRQDLGRTRKGKKLSHLVVSSPDKTTSTIVKTPELLKSKKSSPKSPPVRSTRTTPSKEGLDSKEQMSDNKRDVKKSSPALTKSKTSSPKTTDNSYRQGIQRTSKSKIKNMEASLPSEDVKSDVKIKSPALSKSKSISPGTPDNFSKQGVHGKPRSRLPRTERLSPSHDVKIKSPALLKLKTTSPKTPVLKPSNISPKQGILKTPSKRGKVSSPAVASPVRKTERRIDTPLISRSSSQSSSMSTPAGRLIGSPGDQCLSVSRSSSTSSSPVRRLRSREHVDRYGEGCSRIGAGSSSLEDSEEFVVPSCSRQTMSPLTEDNNKGEDSSVSEYDINDDEACITDAMKAEEQKIHQQTVKEENKEKIECMDEWATMQEGQKFARLQHLLNKSNIYCQFLLKRMEEQRDEEEKKQKRMAKRQENKEIKEAAKQQQVQRRSGRRRKENDQADSQGSADNIQPEPTVKTKRGRKRKAEHSSNLLSDYITEEAIVKRQKMNESKSPTQTPLVDRSPEQCVPNTPKSASPKKGKAGTDVHTSQPSLLTGGVMRPYQIEGLEWLKVLYENGVNGILADEMGLGKTVQCIGLIAHLIEMGVKGPFLVAAPLSTLPNWVSEFHRFTPKIPVILYHGSIEERTVLRRKISKLVSVGPYVSQPVIVTSYEICMNDQKHLYNYQWKHMIVDEGHRIKNLNCRLIRELKTYDSANRLLLTGTPLQNNLQELWSLLNFLLPDIFDDLSSFQRLFDFSAIGDEESKERILAQEREHQVLKTLHSILTPFLLRRLKTDVELSLPPKKELLVYAPLTNKQTTFYKAALDKTIENLVGPQKNKKEEVVEINSLGRPVRKKRLNINYKVFDEQNFEELASTLTEIKTAREPEMRTTNHQQQDSVVSIPLRNILMLLRKCCNHPYLLEYPLDPATQQFKIDEELVSCSGKMKILDQLLAGLRAKGHKVLIFSQMTKMLDILEDYCYLRKYNYCRLDGAMSVQDRREQMKAFCTDSNVFLFLLSTRAGGLGLNLSAADTVIIYDSDWNPQADLQAQDRCHRIGQTKPIIVYRLVTANTVDQKMVERASSKRRLEKLVIHKGKFKGKLDDNVLTAEELRELLEAANHDQVITNDGLILSKNQLESLLDRSDLIAQHKKKNRIVPDVDNTDSALFKVIDSSS